MRSWTTTPFVGSTRRFRRCSSRTCSQLVNTIHNLFTHRLIFSNQLLVNDELMVLEL